EAVVHRRGRRRARPGRRVRRVQARRPHRVYVPTGRWQHVQLRLAALAVLAIVIATSAPAAAERVVAVTPLSTLGAEDKSAATKKLLGQIEKAIASLPATRVVPATHVTTAIDRAKKPQL